MEASQSTPTAIQPKSDQLSSMTQPGMVLTSHLDTISPTQTQQPCVMQVVIQMPDGKNIPVQFPAVVSTPTGADNQQVQSVPTVPGIPGPHSGTNVLYSDAVPGTMDKNESSLRTKQVRDWLLLFTHSSMCYGICTTSYCGCSSSPTLRRLYLFGPRIGFSVL